MFSGRAPARGRLQARRMRFVRGLRLTMANTPKKAKDPTEVALSAIQEALNISDTAADTSRNASMRNENSPPVAPPTPPMFDDPSFDPRPAANERTMFDPIEEPRSARRAAN